MQLVNLTQRKYKDLDQNTLILSSDLSQKDHTVKFCLKYKGKFAIRRFHNIAYSYINFYAFESNNSYANINIFFIEEPFSFYQQYPSHLIYCTRSTT